MLIKLISLAISILTLAFYSSTCLQNNQKPMQEIPLRAGNVPQELSFLQFLYSQDSKIQHQHDTSSITQSTFPILIEIQRVQSNALTSKKTGQARRLWPANPHQRLLPAIPKPNSFVACIVAEGYYPDFQLFQCKNCSRSHCIQCPNNICVDCSAGYKVQLGFCIEEICEDLCEACQRVLVPDSMPSIFISNCKSCSFGFYLDAVQRDGKTQVKCLSCGYPCEDCQGFDSNCTQCMKGYYRFQYDGEGRLPTGQDPSIKFPNLPFYFCLPCVDNCILCLNADLCTTCQEGYQLTRNENRCYRCPYPCSTCLQPSSGVNISEQCQSCQLPFRIVPTQDNRCVRCLVDNCIDCTSAEVCKGCAEDYTLVDNQCIYDCAPLCQVCDLGKCSLCRTGYTAVQDYDGNSTLLLTTCQKCTPDNCKICTQENLGFCLYCVDGFYASDGKCHQCDNNCLVCTANICLKSRPIPDQSGTTIYQGMSVACQVGCSRCEVLGAPNTFCLDKQQGYFLQNGLVYPCGKGCLSCFQRGRNIICLQCPIGLVRNPRDLNECLRCENCQRCDPGNITKCLSCQLGTFWQNFACIPCAVQNCSICDKQGLCNECNSGYVPSIDGKICVECSLQCLQCAAKDPRICLACGEGYFQKNKVCIACQKGCVTCVSVTECVSCQQGWLLEKGYDCVRECHFPCLNCVRDEPQNCNACAAGYQLVSSGNQDMTCQPIIICNETRCTFCALGYYAVGSQCVRCFADNCSQCDSGSLTCKSCFPGYYIAPQSICRQCALGCRTCSNPQTCFSCIDGYTLLRKRDQLVFKGKGSGKCQACLTPCATCYGDTSRCTSCVTNYTFDGWKCLSNSNVKFRLEMDSEIKNFFNSYTGVKVGVVSLLGDGFQNDSNYIASRSFESVPRDQSLRRNLQQTTTTLLSQELSVPPGESASTSAQTMSNMIVANSLLDNVTVIDLVITQINDPNLGSNSVSDKNIGIFLGVLIPIGIAIVIVSLICVLRSRRKRSQKIKVLKQNQKHFSEMEFRNSSAQAIYRNSEQFEL